MNYKEELELMHDRDYMVVKGNEIIQRARFDLSLLEQKTFCYAVSKICPGDKPGTWYTFSINEYCEVCGIERNNGKNLKEVKDALKQLRDKSFWLQNEKGELSTVGWLDKAMVIPKSGKVKIRFDEDMEKYLMALQTRGNYTQYSLLNVLPMRSGYSIRLYELLKSYVGLNKRHPEIETDELKAKMSAPYVNFKDFRRKALEVATKEINLYTDIEISWEPVTKGRKVISVRFDIKARNGWDAYLALQKGRDQLDGQYEMDVDGTITELRKGK